MHLCTYKLFFLSYICRRKRGREGAKSTLTLLATETRTLELDVSNLRTKEYKTREKIDPPPSALKTPRYLEQ